MPKVFKRASFALIAFVLALALGARQNVFAQVAPILQTGSLEAVSGGTFLHLGVPVVNNAGRVAFYAAVRISDSEIRDGVFRFENGVVSRVAFKGSEAPGVGRFNLFFNDSNSFEDDFEQNVHIPALNNRGEVGFFATLSDAPSGENRGFYLDGSEVVRSASAPGAGLPAVHFALNDSGELLHSETFLFPIDQAYYLASKIGNVLVVASTLMGTNFSSVIPMPSLNNRSEVAFAADPPGVEDRRNVPFENLYMASGGRIFNLWPRNVVSPDGDGMLDFVFPHVVLNNNGEVYFNARLTNNTGGSAANNGAFVATTNSLRLLLREGQAISAIPGTFVDDFAYPVPNDSNQVVIWVEIDSGIENDLAVLLLEGTNMTVLARQFEASPDGDGVVYWPENQTHVEPSLNNRGQVAVRAFFGPAGGPYTQEGILFIDADGSKEVVARAGRPLAGRQVSGIRMLGQHEDGHDLYQGRGGRRALNENGEVVFRASFADGGQGLFLWRRPGSAPGTSLAFTSLTRLNQGMFRFTVSTTNQWPLTVLAAEDLTNALSNWVSLGGAASNGQGQFSFTDSASTNLARRYYMLRSP